MMGALYGGLALAFLCLNGPLARQIPWFRGYWILGLLLTLLVVTVFLLRQQGINYRSATTYERLLLFYFLLLSISSIMHYVGLAAIPGTTVINAKGMQAMQALRQERAYAPLYLLFPLMLIVQVEIQRVVSPQIIVRWFALAAFLSACTALYQHWGGTGFLHDKLWSIRYEGLATDPNALALSVFLLIPFLVIGSCIEKSMAIKLFYLFLLGTLLVTLMHTGSRTGAVGIVLLLAALPWVLAVSMRGWKRYWRFSLAALPVMALVLTMAFSSVLMPYLAKLGYTESRLVHTWHKFEDKGINGLFFKNENRGKYLVMGKELAEAAPWGGWGPAGFYRESSNMYFYLRGWKYLGGWKVGRAGDYRDSAVNHYLMIASDFGIPILLLNLAIILLPLGMGLKALGRVQDMRTRFILGMLLASNILFLFMIFTVPPSYFMGVCWVWAAHLAALLVIAGRHGVVPRIAQRPGVKTAVIAIASLLVLVTTMGGYVTSFGKCGYVIPSQDYWWKQH